MLLDRVRELKAELKVVEAELAELRKQVVPRPPPVSEEMVRRYLRLSNTFHPKMADARCA